MMNQKTCMLLFTILIIINSISTVFSEQSIYNDLLNVVNTENDETSSSISDDKNTFVFTRKMKNTKNYDIYITKYVNNKWTQPEPIAKINTDADEISPFISHDGNSLFFSSNRKESLKNTKATRPSFDLYVTEKEGDSWSAPVPVFGALNTTDDETNPYITSEGNLIYFTRTKFNDSKKSAIIQAEKENDIWGVNMQTSDISYITSLRIYMAKKSEILQGFWVSAYRENSPKRDILFLKVDNDGNSQILEPGDDINSPQDENSILEISEKLIMVSDNNSNAGDYDIALLTVPQGLFAETRIFQKETQKDDADALKEPDQKKIPEKKSITKKEDKKTASKKISKKSQVKKKSIPSTENGESVFIIDVKSNSIEEIQSIPLKILFFDSIKAFSNPVDSKVISPDSKNLLEIRTSSSIKRIVVIPEDESVEGFAAEYIINKNGVMTGTLSLTKTEEKEFKIKPVYFRFNSCDIQLQDIPYLHDLIEYMRNNSDIRISIEGYSDSRGTEKANMETSIRRAEKIRDYLIIMGIDSSRLSIKGHGFAGKNDGDTSQQNRRVDFVIAE